MKNQLNLDRLDRNLSFIEQTVGKDWLENWVHHMRDNMGRMQYRVPPLALLWLKAKDELALGQLRGHVVPSESTLRIARLGSNLEALTRVPGYNEQIPLLKQGQQIFLHVEYRLDVAATLARQKLKLFLAHKTGDPDIKLGLSAKEVAVYTIRAEIGGNKDLKDLGLSAIAEDIKAIKPPAVLYVDLPPMAIYTLEQLLTQGAELMAKNIAMPSGIEVILSTIFLDKKSNQLIRSYRPMK
ncbi:hypothetical protein [Desulfofalx alkaliphila]|uniref:hypothetical protein n=1 Tax=Desulfofalx alkaliphila TaxID=105483 RepID=UPI0004E161D0|nr:hypothetical protein [Desulfofalx alkaliphila]